MITFDKFLPVYFFSDTEKPVVTISVKWKNVYPNNLGGFFFFFFLPVLNHVYTTVALLDRLPYIHSCSLCSCSRSWRVNDIVVPSEHHLVMRWTTFWSMKLKTSVDFQMFQFLEDQLEKPKTELHSIYKTLTQASQMRCCRAASETNYLNHFPLSLLQ